ncbi:deoxyguanosinetriphosphate triphosphohydrolase [Oscillatoria amoena NRMC-F 0135]|nr:deoxyguanosinetriphosphate triphosphohydrolase [Oscillatoria laete-virens]MDL5047534.1 deoxyguanosinetriphosphate triphosphohydrolase [Oscillatoria amoena NRMC-F 0135]MDL5054644.1 deoxyguanosinetriphosphate triphosphohydrolase [Oscillatoria laete-virens NRMC-F 0139]
MNSWQKLLSWQRLGKEELPTQDPARSQFQMDYDRLVFSSAFRRLQDKTQVVPLPQTDYVRTRLTHSLEVSCIARTLGTLIGKTICAREKTLSAQIAPTDFGAICSAAALAHDLGNPPFGHSGEDAIRHWFRTSQIARALHGSLTPEQFADIDRYEGNAQGFRIVTRLQMPDNPGGMQLTYAVLGAFTKYPRPSLLPPGFDAGPRRSMKKFGFFTTEWESFGQVAQGLGLKPLGSGGPAYQRHPLAFVTEAADDISYRIIDFEDGFRLGLIDYDTIRRLFGELAGSQELAKAEAKISGQRGVVEYLRARAINRLVEQVVEVFAGHEESIVSGEYDRCLIEDIPANPLLNEIQKKSVEQIYRSATNLEVELAGFEVIGGLLDRLVGAVEDVAHHGKAAAAPSRKLLQLIPEQFVGPGRQPHTSAFGRLIRILDYVSGMTDSYAVSLHKKLHGINLPVR